METVKKTAEHTIFKKHSGRYAVRGADKVWINGDDKLKILAGAGLTKAQPKKKAAAPAEKAAAEAPAVAAPAAEDGGDAGEKPAE